MARFKTEIWKLQRPVFTNQPTSMVLMYNEDRSKEGSFPMTPEVLDLFDDDEYKMFVHGTISKDGQIEFEGEAEWQEW